MIKVRNKGNNILFIDSLALTLRPNIKNGDFSLVDEQKAMNDPQFMKCAVLGSIEYCPIDKNFEDNKEKSHVLEILDETKTEIKEPIIEEVKEEKETEEKDIEEKKTKKTSKKGKKEKKIEEKAEEKPEEYVVEPKNVDSVIVVPTKAGATTKTAKVKAYKLSDMPMPAFIDSKEIRDMSQDDLDLESQGEKDIDLSLEDN